MTGGLRALGNAPRPVHVWGAKLIGATMWCWILWRFKHDWRDVLVCMVNLYIPFELHVMYAKYTYPWAPGTSNTCGYKATEGLYIHTSMHYYATRYIFTSVQLLSYLHSNLFSALSSLYRAIMTVLILTIMTV